MAASDRSREWMQAYNSSKPEDNMQMQVVNLLAQPIKDSQTKLIEDRRHKLVDLFNSASEASIKKLYQRLLSKGDAFWGLIDLELGDYLEELLMNIVKRKVSLGERFTDPDKKGTVKSSTKPPQPPKVKDTDPSPPIDVDRARSFSKGELVGDIVGALYGDLASGGLASLGLPSGLPQSLLAHYMFAKGRKYVLSIAEMGECNPNFSLSNSREFVEISGEVAKGGIHRLNCIIDSKANTRGTLGQFKIHFNGTVQYKGDQIIFEGGITFSDYWNFEAHPGKTSRTDEGEFMTGFGSTIKGKPFPITSEVAPIKEVHDRGKIQQFWEGTAQQKRLKEAEEKRRLSDSVKAAEFDHQHFDTGPIKGPDGKTRFK